MIEIERKFLVEDGAWRSQVTRSVEIVQGYFQRAGNASVRIRVIGDSANLNIKGRVVGCARKEFEYPIPVAEAQEMLRLFCAGRVVAKTRHFVPAAEPGLQWEIDEYHGPFEGHFTAELEIPSEDFVFQRPEWLGEEKTADRRFGNGWLAAAQCWPE